MDSTTIVHDSTQTALEHAASLHFRMSSLRTSDDPALRAYYREVQDLVCELVQVRNTAHRLERTSARPAKASRASMSSVG